MRELLFKKTKNNRISHNLIICLAYLISTLICLTYVNAEPNYEQVTWLISIKEPTTPSDDTDPRQFLFGSRNFYDALESNLFTMDHINQRSPYNVIAVRRDNSNTQTTVPGSPDDYTEQYYDQYFLTKDLSSKRGYFVLEDTTLCMDSDVNTALITFCEIRYYVSFHRNYKRARLYYETQNTADNTIKRVFGGPEGIIDSNDIEFFLKYYLQAFCPYRHGIYSKYVLDDLFTDGDDDEGYLTREHVVLDSTALSDFIVPLISNDNTGVTEECQFTENVTTAGDSESGVLYIPSEFYPNCSRETVSPNPASASPQYLWCLNNYSSSPSVKPFYYTTLGKCHKNNRVFLKLRSLHDENPEITTTVTCTNVQGDTTTGNLPASTFFSDFWDDHNNRIQLINIDNTFTCDYTYGDGAGKSTCQANLVTTCTVDSVSPDYFNTQVVVSSTIVAEESDDSTANDYIKNEFTVSFKIMLYK